MHSTKSRLAIGSPCLAPLPSSMLLSRLPTWLTLLVKLLSSTFIHSLSLLPKPAISMTAIIKSCERLSNAFSKSMLRSIPFLSLDQASCMVSYSVRVTSPMYLPSTKPFWSSPMIWGSTFFTRSATVPEMILYRVVSSVMGLQFFRAILHFFPLGSRVITPCLCISDSCPISSANSMYFIIGDIRSAANFL